MNQEEVAQHREEWRPVVRLIGIMLLVSGVSSALSRNPAGIWQMYRYFQAHPVPAGYTFLLLAWMTVQFLLAVGLIIAGIGLWRRELWARRAAIALLGCQVAVLILIAFTMPLFRWQVQVINIPVTHPPYWLGVMQSLQPFTLISEMVLLLFLSAPAVRQEWGERSHPGLLTMIAERCRRRLPAVAPLSLFLGLIFLCWGAGPWLNYFLSSHGLFLMLHQQVLNFVADNFQLLPALANLVAGVWLLGDWRWSRPAAIIAIFVGIAYLLYSSIHSLMLAFRPETAPHGWMLFAIVLLTPIGIALQLVIPIAILLLLRKAPPERMGEPAPEG